MAALPEPSLKGAFFLPAVGVFAHSRSLGHLVFLFFEQRYKSVYTYKAPACMLSPNMGVCRFYRLCLGFRLLVR